MPDELASVALAIRKRMNIDPDTAVLGNGAGIIHDSAKPGYYYVRILQADGNFSTPVSIRVHPNANIPMQDGVVVFVGRDEYGAQVILSANTRALSGTTLNAFAFNPLDRAVNQFVSQSSIATLFCQRHSDTTNKPFYVVVMQSFLLRDTLLSFFSGDELNLASYVPASGLHRYVCVFVLADDTLAAYASTAVSTADPLGVSDLQECISAAPTDALPVWAYRIKATDTALSAKAEDSVDLRMFINLRAASSSTGAAGIPNPVTGTLTITSGYQVLAYGLEVAAGGEIACNGELYLVN